MRTNLHGPSSWARIAALAFVAIALTAGEAPVTRTASSPPDLTDFSYTLPSIAEGTTAPVGSSLDALQDSGSGTLQTDYTNNTTGQSAPVGIAVIAVDNANGHWDATPDWSTTSTWTPIGAVSSTSALLVADVPASSIHRGGLRFVPNPGFAGSATLTFVTWDSTQTSSSGTAGQKVDPTANTDFGTTPATLSITVTAPTNVAPVLAASDGNLALNATTVAWTADPGTTVPALLGRIAEGTVITDSDGPGTGIAITAVDLAHGTWQFDIGAGWQALPAVSTANPLVLADVATARVRLLPTAGFSGVIASALSFRAWDRSDLVASGGIGATSSSTAYSTRVDTASIVVAPATAATYTGTTPSFAGTLSVRGSTLYVPLGLVTDEGMARLDAALAALRGDGRAFAWDAVVQRYVELPTAPTGGLDATHGIFLATKRDVSIDCGGRCQALPFDLTLQPGWNFITFPALTDGVQTAPITSHPWADVDALDSAGAHIGNPTFDAQIGEPWLWDGSAYHQVATMSSNVGYWVDNGTGALVTLRRTAGAVTRGVRTATASSQPPPPPAGDTAGDAHHGCGAGGAIAAATATLLLGVRLRRVTR